jgi:hypothetical protein
MDANGQLVIFLIKVSPIGLISYQFLVKWEENEVATERNII